MATKYTKEELTCPECAAEGIEFVAKDMRGLNGHRMFKHGVHPSPQLPLEKQDLLISDSKLAQILDERLGIISGQLDGLTSTVDALNDRLEQEQQKREANVATLNERVKAAEAKTIADFPAEDKAEFLVSSLQRFAKDKDALAKISKATGLSISSPSEVEASDKVVKEIERLVKEGKAKKDKEPEKPILKGKTDKPGYKYLQHLDMSIPVTSEEPETVKGRVTGEDAKNWVYLEHLDLSYRK